ncbi:MAG: pitrilysin family protein [Chloroflexi bacterium]|nr:pitrilysin family protein [Chloroflexota bacterium]
MPRKSTAARTATSLPHSGNVAVFELNNGVRIMAYENFSTPSVIVSGFLHAGARDEGSAAGLAGFTTDCMMRGTRSHNYEAIFEQSEAVGASLSVSSGVFTSGFYSKSLAEDLPMMLDLLAEVLREPTFPEAEIERERSEWLTELQERSNSTRAMSSLAFYTAAYPETHPFHRSVNGYPETARTITRDDVARFHREFFAPAGLTVVVVGAVHANEARDRVAAAFGDWSATRPQRAELPPVPALQGHFRKHITMAGKSQTNVLLGHPALPTTHPDWLSCALMNSILGQFGMYGRLGESVRKEEGLVYYIGSHFDGGMAEGAWTLSAGTNPDTVDRVVDIAVREMRRIRDRKVTARELEDNQRYFIGSLPLQMETNEGIAGQIISMARYNRPLDHLLTYPERVRAVTTADVQAAARRWLHPDDYVLITAGK